MKSFKEYLNEVNGKPKTDIERVMTHFNLTQEDIDKMSEEEIKKLIDKLPPRGSGLSQ
jgi:hypothetical protein